MPALQQPEAYVSHAASLFTEGGGLANEETRKFFTGFIRAFATWIETIAGSA